MNWIEKLHQELGDDSFEIMDEKNFFIEIVRTLIKPEVNKFLNQFSGDFAYNELIKLAFL